MEHPASVKVGPFQFEVVSTPEAVASMNKVQYPNLCYGQCDGKKLTITLDSELAPGQMRDTLLHEVLHATYCMGGGPQKIEDEEAIVGLLASRVLDVLRANPDLVTYLLDGADVRT